MDLNFSQFLKHPFKEVLLNMIRLFRAEKHYATYKKGDVREVKVPEGYDKVFSDYFLTHVDKDKWKYGMPWGDFHPQSLHQYYDNDGTLSYIDTNGLNLELKNLPKTWKKADLPDWRRSPEMPDEFTIPTGVGFISSKETWQYGWFEAWIQLPEGQSYWPAYWFSGLKSWPPEIDVFEGYSHMGPRYESYTLFNRWFKKPNRRIRPNLHYGQLEEGNKDDYSSYDIPVADATKRLVQYVCHWEKDFIRIYYDGLLILETKSKNVLQWFNKPDAQQYVIFNHGLHMDYPANPDESKMIVRSFNVYQKQTENASK